MWGRTRVWSILYVYKQIDKILWTLSTHLTFRLWNPVAVPYYFTSSFTYNDRLTFAKAVEAIQAVTCLRCLPFFLCVYLFSSLSLSHTYTITSSFTYKDIVLEVYLYQVCTTNNADRLYPHWTWVRVRRQLLRGRVHRRARRGQPSQAGYRYVYP